jgi:hypothetical protein
MAFAPLAGKSRRKRNQFDMRAHLRRGASAMPVSVLQYSVQRAATLE